jgi:hypothetical protein
VVRTLAVVNFSGERKFLSGDLTHDSVIEASFKVLTAVPDIMNKVQLFQERILTDVRTARSGRWRGGEKLAAAAHVRFGFAELSLLRGFKVPGPSGHTPVNPLPPICPSVSGRRSPGRA